MLKIITISCIIAAVSLNSQEVKGSLLPNVPNVIPNVPNVIPNVPNVIPNVIPKDLPKNLPIPDILPKDLINGLTDGILEKGLVNIIAKSGLSNIIKIIQKILNAEVACAKAFHEVVDFVSKSVSAVGSCLTSNGTANIEKLTDQTSDGQKSVHNTLQQCLQNPLDESCLNAINKSLAGLNINELTDVVISEILYPLNLIGSLSDVFGCIENNLSHLNLNFCTTALDTGHCINSIVQIFT